MTDDYDVVVIGAGPAGENAAVRAVRGGLTAAIVEERLVGGECSYWACIPSKALLRPAHALAAARRLPGAAEAVTGELSAKAVFARRDSFISSLDDAGQVSWLDGASIDLVRGHGRLAGDRLVEVEAPESGGVRRLRARHAVVVATGTAPAVPPVEGLADARPWTNREATTASVAPPRLVVVGGGVVAVEMAQAYRALGSAVTVLVRGDRLLARAEPFAGSLVSAAIEADGVEVRYGVSPTSVSRTDVVRVVLDDGSTVVADELLVAAGRRPLTGSLGLDAVGLTPGESVEVDDSMRATGVEGGWLYAVGDVNGRSPLTHMGKYQARVCGDVIAARAAGRDDTLPALRASADGTAVPQVVFTDPQVCWVGRTAAEAADAGLRVRAVDHDLGAVSGAALLADGYTGQARLVVDEDRRVLVGATFVGQDTAELLHSATIAVIGEVPLERLWHAVPSFPTVSEVWLRLLEDYGL